MFWGPRFRAIFNLLAGSQGGRRRANDGRGLTDRENATAADLRSAHADTRAGMFFSNLIVYFIILTTAATLHAHGQTDITTARQAAEALRPLAGNGAYLLFTLGLIALECWRLGLVLNYLNLNANTVFPRRP